MVISRDVVLEAEFLAKLESTNISQNDPRILAAIFYVKHAVRFHDARKIQDTPSGPLYAYRLKPWRDRRPLLVFFTERADHSVHFEDMLG